MEIIEFDKWLNQKRNLADNSRSEYTRRLKKFFEWLGDSSITEAAILDYLDSLKKDGMSDKTINCYRDAISAYIKFRGLNIEKPPIRKLVENLPDVIEDEKLFENIIIPQADEIFKRKRCKAKALLYLFHDSGLRPSSVVALKRENFHLGKNMGICLNVKVKKQQFFYFTNKAAVALEIYFDSDEEKKNAFNISRSGIARMFSILKKSDKLKHINLRPCLFRHTVASKLLNDGLSDKEVQEFLCHSSSASMGRYVKVNVEKFKAKYLNIMNN